MNLIQAVSMYNTLKSLMCAFPSYSRVETVKAVSAPCKDPLASVSPPEIQLVYPHGHGLLYTPPVALGLLDGWLGSLEAVTFRCQKADINRSGNGGGGGSGSGGWDPGFPHRVLCFRTACGIALTVLL